MEFQCFEIDLCFILIIVVFTETAVNDINVRRIFQNFFLARIALFRYTKPSYGRRKQSLPKSDTGRVPLTEQTEQTETSPRAYWMKRTFSKGYGYNVSVGHRTRRDFLFVFAGYTRCKLLAAACSDTGRKQTLVVRNATARTRTIKTCSPSTESLKFTVRAHTLNVQRVYVCIQWVPTRCEPAVIISLNKQDKNVSRRAIHNRKEREK